VHAVVNGFGESGIWAREPSAFFAVTSISRPFTVILRSPGWRKVSDGVCPVALTVNSPVVRGTSVFSTSTSTERSFSMPGAEMCANEVAKPSMVATCDVRRPDRVSLFSVVIATMSNAPVGLLTVAMSGMLALMLTLIGWVPMTGNGQV
jgi:hypothetical protein